MLKLKYLFDNRDLVHMLLENWWYNKEKISELDKFRISSNAIYPFIMNDSLHFLRFSPITEKAEKDLLAELEFIDYLCTMDYPAPRIVKTKDGKTTVNASTPWGNYLAVVFEGVGGRKLEDIAFSEELYYGLGKTLGQLHKLSKKYTPVNYGRPDWKQHLNNTKNILMAHSVSSNAIIEVDILLDFFKKIEIDSDNYGLIHYDFELDNIFFDSSKNQFHVIDFDDSVYHWFAMDIEKAFESIEDELPLEYQDKAKESFLSGYRSEMELSENMQRLFPVFKRYANLYAYGRCLHAVNEAWDNEPKWMETLRIHIQKLMEGYSKDFGQKIIY